MISTSHPVEYDGLTRVKLPEVTSTDLVDCVVIMLALSLSRRRSKVLTLDSFAGDLITSLRNF